MGDTTTVLLATPTYPPETGGSSVYAKQLAQILRDSDEYRVYVVTEYDNALSNFRYKDDVPVVRLCTSDKQVIQEYGTPVQFIKERWENAEIDIFHIHPHTSNLQTMFRSVEQLNKAFIYDCRGPALLHQNMNFGLEKLYISVTDEVTKKIIETRNVNNENIFKIPVSAILEDIGEPISKDKDGLNCVFVASIHPHKGLDIAVQAVLDSDTEANLTIVGDGPARNQARSADDMEDSIEYIGEVDHSTALAEIDKADVLLAPFSTEGQPRVVTEAIKLDTPVIGTEAGNIPDVVQNSGIIVDRDESKFQKAIENVNANINEYNVLASSNDLSNAESTKDYSKEEIKNKLFEVYDKALKKVE